MSEQRIVIVHDDAAIESLLLDVLEEEGYTHLLCLDNQAAVSGIRQLQPALVVLDIKNGRAADLWLFERLRRTPATAHIPLLLLTIEPLAVGVEQLRAAKLALVCKPFTLEDLTSSVMALIGAPRLLARSVHL